MAFAADDLRNIIESGWSLTGELSKTASDTMKEVVTFFSRPQIMGNEVVKAVEVTKAADLENDGIIKHPQFIEERDTFIIRVRYRAVDIQEVTYNDALSNMEAMQNEVIRLIETTFDPSVPNGTFFRHERQWTDESLYNTAQPDIIRSLRLTLYQIKSRTPEGFRGFGGVLVFDTSLSEGDNKPAGDYTFTEAYAVSLEEGFENLRVLTNDDSRGIGVPKLERGEFRGVFQAEMYAKRSDLDGNTIEKLDNIYKVQSNGQLATVVFLHAHTNTEAVPKTLTSQSYIKVSRMRRSEDVVGLLIFRIIGDVERPSTYTIT
jgi:hypothetical protein